MTVPPEKATDSALAIPLVLAAFAVRTFALVATDMPAYPAAMERAEPQRKHTAVAGFLMMQSSTKRHAIKITRILYSEKRNA